MPGYKGHIIGGVSAFFLLMFLTTSLCIIHTYSNPFLLLWYLLCAVIGSLFPDIDIKSKGQQLFYLLLTVVASIIILQKNWIALSIMTPLSLFPLFVSHRGTTHQLWFIICIPFCLPLFVAFTAPHLIVPAFMGYLFFSAGSLSHLLLDFGVKNFFKRGLFKKKKR